MNRNNWKVLYRGVNTQFYVTFLPTFVYFFLYEYGNRFFRKLLERNNLQKYSAVTPMVTATASELATLLIVVPMDTLKKRYQVNQGQYQYKSMAHGLVSISKKEGILRLFMASPVYLFYATLYNTILFQIYEGLRIKQMHLQNKTND